MTYASLKYISLCVTRSLIHFFCILPHITLMYLWSWHNAANLHTFIQLSVNDPSRTFGLSYMRIFNTFISTVLASRRNAHVTANGGPTCPARAAAAVQSATVPTNGCAAKIWALCVHIRTVGTGQDTGSPHLYVRGGKDSNNDICTLVEAPWDASKRSPTRGTERQEKDLLPRGGCISLSNIAYICLISLWSWHNASNNHTLTQPSLNGPSISLVPFKLSHLTHRCKIKRDVSEIKSSGKTETSR